MKSLFAVLFAASLTSNELPVESTTANTTTTPAIVTAASPTPSPQKDPKATSILSEVTKTTKSRKTITLDFTFISDYDKKWANTHIICSSYPWYICKHKHL